MNKKIPWKRVLDKIILIITVTACVLFVLYLENGSIKEDVAIDMEWEAVSREDLKTESYTVAENDALRLIVTENTMELLVEDKQNGRIYRSNPENAADDEIAFGLNRTNVMSQLFIEYADSQSNFYTTNSYIGSVRDGYVDFVTEEKGILVTYYFYEQGFEVPVYYGIEDEYFTAKILCDQIISNGKYTITAISLLPYMGSGGLEDEGYLVVPDGSGSIINFNNGKQSYQAYNQPVYGTDAALNILSSIEVKKDNMLPVFGIKSGDYAMLAVIARGEYQAEIRAEVSRKSTSNNIAYSQIRFVRVETNTLLGGSNNEERTEMLSEQFIDFPEYEVRYYFLKAGSGYTEMALRYQRYLEEEKGMKPLNGNMDMNAKESGTKLNVTFIGGIKLPKTLLGIPYHSVEALTSYQDVRWMSLELKQEGNLDLDVRYIGFLKDGYKNSKLPSKIEYESKLGSKKEFQSLIKGLADAGIEFYPSFDLVNMFCSGNGFQKTDSARNVNRTAAYQYSYYLTTGDKIPDTAYTLLTPNEVKKVTSRLIKSMEKQNISIVGLEGITSILYSDFKKNGTSRNESGEIFTSLIKEVSENTDKLLLDKSYAYGAAYADVITNVPLAGSEFDMTDSSIPFYQIVFAGYVEMYSGSVNMQGDIKDYILNIIEAGAYPSYLLMESDSKTVMDTDYTEFYANNYYDWKNHLLETAEYIAPLSAAYGERIISHSRENNVSRTEYENGICVYVNYNSYDIEVEGYVINARDYLITGDKEVE